MGILERAKNFLFGERGEKRSVVTTGYEPPRGVRAWGWQVRNLPVFDFDSIRMMLLDSTIRLGLAMRAAPICSAEIAYPEDGEDGKTNWKSGVQANSEEVAEFVRRQTDRFWRNDVPRLIEAQVWGWAAAEVVYTLRNGRIYYDRMEERHAADVRALEEDGRLKAVRFRNLNDSCSATNTIDLPIPKAFWHGFRANSGEYYPESILFGAYSPWFDKWTDGGALDTRRLFMHKDAYGGQSAFYPPGTTYIEGIGEVPNRDIAREMVEQAAAGAVVVAPSAFDASGNQLWRFEHAQVSANPGHILQYPQDLDVEMLRGMEIPDDILTAEASGSWEGKRVPQNAFYNGLDVWCSGLLGDWKRQVMTPLVFWNFGPGAEFELRHKPLALQAQEQSGEKDGEKDDPFASMFGGGGGGGQPPQQPQPGQQQMSLRNEDIAAAIVGQGILSAESIVSAARDKMQRMRVSEGWITIGSKKSEDGKRKGGARVYIKNGKIAKGPDGMVGNSPGDPRGKNKAKERKRRGLPGAETKLGKAIADAVGDDLDDQEGFHEIVNDVWKRKRQEAQEFDSSLSEAIGQFIPKNKRGNFTQEVQRAEDPDQIPQFDELLEFVQRDHPHILDFDPEASFDDPEDALFRLLQQGKVDPPAKHSDEVIDEAFEIAESMGFGRESSSMTKEEQEALDAVPFSLRPWERYRMARKPSPGQKSLFDEDVDDEKKEHRETKVSASGETLVRAKAGGETSPVNGEEYKGGQWMPIHGLSEKQPKSKAKPKQTASSSQPFAGKGKEKSPRSPMSPEQIKEEQDRRETQKKWDKVKSGPVGELFWMGERPHRLKGGVVPLKPWWSFLEKGGEGIEESIIKTFEPIAHENAKRDIEEWEAKGNKGSIDTVDEYMKWNIEENARYNDSMTTKKHLKSHPRSNYAKALIDDFLDKNPDTEGLERLHDTLTKAVEGNA